MTKAKLDAVDVLNWDYLVEIGEYVEGRAKTPEMALRGFAYSFTSTADESVRNEMLRDILFNATCRCSKDEAEEFVAKLAVLTKSDRELLRRFGKERGINLKRG
ncbi:MAG TPA: hypothetical protein VJO53_09165 [Candidatus Acidoferrales bacterium]|nr:hypothetical protein [Candidatus Acidoferrales bacterium]